MNLVLCSKCSQPLPFLSGIGKKKSVTSGVRKGIPSVGLLLISRVHLTSMTSSVKWIPYRIVQIKWHSSRYVKCSKILICIYKLQQHIAEIERNRF